MSPSSDLEPGRPLFLRNLRRQNPEAALARSVHEFLQLKLPTKAVHWHTPNESPGGKVWLANQKRMGLLPGYPDISILHEGQLYLIELKVGKNGLTDNQRDCIDRLTGQGAKFRLCRSIEDIENALKSWGLLKGKAEVRAL